MFRRRRPDQNEGGRPGFRARAVVLVSAMLILPIVLGSLFAVLLAALGLAE
ncbi:MAG: hypothetical protein AAGC79_19155 [Pseudomonadota bacterium]